MVGVWNAALDMDTRPDHRKLDGQEADKNGYSHIHSLKAKGPHLFGVAKEDFNCRCVKIYKVDGILPDTRRARDYQDSKYQQKIVDRMDELLADGMTVKQAEMQAKKEISAPNVTVPYQSYDEWLSGKKKEKPKSNAVTIKMPDGSERSARADKSSGIQIVQPVDLDTDMQKLSVDDVKNFINQIPKEHYGVIKEIHLLDTYDEFEGEIFDSAIGRYDLKTKNIELYRNDWLNDDQRNTLLAGTIWHETAHALQKTLGEQFLEGLEEGSQERRCAYYGLC